MWCSQELGSDSQILCVGEKYAALHRAVGFRFSCCYIPSSTSEGRSLHLQAAETMSWWQGAHIMCSELTGPLLTLRSFCSPLHTVVQLIPIGNSVNVSQSFRDTPWKILRVARRSGTNTYEIYWFNKWMTYLNSLCWTQTYNKQFKIWSAVCLNKGRLAYVIRSLKSRVKTVSSCKEFMTQNSG
jgi:hypothetical protein